MDFGSAIKALKDGRRVARAGWNGKGMFLALVPAGGMTPRMQPFIVMCTTQATFVPWLASQTDVLADDWEMLQANEGGPLYLDEHGAIKA